MIVRLHLRRRWLVPALFAVACARPPTVLAQSGTSPFDACGPAGLAWAYDDLMCLYQTGARERRLNEARERLRALGAGEAARPWATLVLGHATLNDDETAAIGYYETAAAGFVATGEAEGEVIARQNLRILLRRRGAAAAAAHQVELAVTAAAASNQPLTIARASVIESSHLIETGGDIGRAQRTLTRAARLAIPAGPIGLRRSILFQLATANLYLGLLDEAIDALEQHRALRAEDGSTADAAAVAFNLLLARVAQAEARPVAGAGTRLVEIAESVVEETRALNRPYVEAQAHRVLGELLKPVDPIRAAEHLTRCLQIERPLGYPEVRATCLWSLALQRVRHDPSGAERLSQEAMALAAADHGGLLSAFAWQARLRLVWETLDQPAAIAESMAAIAAVERLRAAQPDEGSRAALFGSWTRDYYWLAGRLLDLETPLLDHAFEVGERLRARVLLERRALGASDVPVTDPSQLPFASLADIREALEPDEAMLWYSIAPWHDLYGDFGGGAWLLAITRGAVTVHRLETRVDLDRQIAAFGGLLRQRAVAREVWMPGARQLGRVLLGGAFTSLPESVRRLTVVSDGVLHELPFEALVPLADGKTVSDGFEVAMVPSATLWLQLRSTERPSTSTAFVLADPELHGDRMAGDLPLARLPGARREARAVAATLGLDSRLVREGAAASEHAIKSLPLGQAGLLHLAAHARTDPRLPDRSAVFLAPGADSEDGWLQPPEIAALGLGGGLVVLSACESAGGPLVAGEGVLSLARAFFAGGAGTVVATRWPLRDDDAAFFMERFYETLATGATVGASVRQARLDAIAAGLPVEAWAGFALIGDSAGRPVQRGTSSRRHQWWWLVLAVVAGMVISYRRYAG